MDFSAAAAYRPTVEPSRPYVRFEMRSQEDRTKKSPDGVSHMVDVAYAIVRASGAKDSLEKVAEEWLAQLETYARDGRIPSHWPAEYRSAFVSWKNGEELPPNGTPIKSWPPLTPAQRQNILRAEILTVEDLATANEEARGRIGMGSLGLKDMAVKWLAEAGSQGAMAKELADVRIQVEDLMRTVQEQAETIKALTPKTPAKVTT